VHFLKIRLFFTPFHQAISCLTKNTYSCIMKTNSNYGSQNPLNLFERKVVQMKKLMFAFGLMAVVALMSGCVELPSMRAQGSIEVFGGSFGLLPRECCPQRVIRVGQPVAVPQQQVPAGPCWDCPPTDCYNCR
jgi:hypothetical protein